jgi:hypothetical protein
VTAYAVLHRDGTRMGTYATLPDVQQAIEERAAACDAVVMKYVRSYDGGAVEVLTEFEEGVQGPSFTVIQDA